MEDLPIGSEIILKVVETEKEECNGCASNERKDGKNVQFKRVK